MVPYTWSLKYLVPLVDLKSKSMSKTIQNVQKTCHKHQKTMKNGRKRRKRLKIAKTAKTADFPEATFSGGGAAAAKKFSEEPGIGKHRYLAQEEVEWTGA